MSCLSKYLHGVQSGILGAVVTAHDVCVVYLHYLAHLQIIISFRGSDTDNVRRQE